MYDRCRVRPVSHRIKQQRWKLFGHILRRDDDIPAQTAMEEYFHTHGSKYRGRTPTSLPTILNDDLKLYKNYLQSTPAELISRVQHTTLLPTNLKSKKDLTTLKNLAQERELWKQITKWIQLVE